MAGTYTKSYRASFNDTVESQAACEQFIRDAVAATDGIDLHSITVTGSEQGDRHDITAEFDVTLDASSGAGGRTVRGRLYSVLTERTMCTGFVETGAGTTHTD